MSDVRKTNAASLVAFVVASVAVVGYFTGIQAPMNRAAPRPPRVDPVEPDEYGDVDGADTVLPAISYSAMSQTTVGPRQAATDLTSLKSVIDPLAKISIAPGEKFSALRKRELRRAFNGAPPTVPHAIEQRSDASCMSCHGKGAKTATLRIPRMSHAYLTNCTQCHVESEPRHMPAVLFAENSFVGLLAPVEGPRSFPGAPPQIPHTTWMRSDCMSCHGYVGRQGLRTTHPWRRSCQQCHAPSATSNQTLIAKPKFLPQPKIIE